MLDIKQLHEGDIVQNLRDGTSYVVIDKPAIDKATAVRVVTVQNPAEWTLITTDSRWVRAIIDLVQNNQEVFDDPPAGTSALMLAYKKLKELLDI